MSINYGNSTNIRLFRDDTVSITCLSLLVNSVSYSFHDFENTPVAQNILTNWSTVAITLSLKVGSTKNYNRLMWDYNRADFPGLNEHIRQIDWDHICDGFTDIDKAVDNWTNTLLEAMKQFIPNKKVVVRTRDKPWYNNDLRRQRRALERCHKKAKNTNNDHTHGGQTPPWGLESNPVSPSCCCARWSQTGLIMEVSTSVVHN